MQVKVTLVPACGLLPELCRFWQLKVAGLGDGEGEGDGDGLRLGDGEGDGFSEVRQARG